MSKLITGMKSVSDFLNDALDAVEKKDFVEALAEAAPWWVEALGHAASEAFPLIGFVLKYAKQLVQENDPEKQGYTACTLAYNRAVEQAIRAKGHKLARPGKALRKMKKLAKGRMPEDIDMQGFTFDQTALSHSFVLESDKVFREFAESAEIEEAMTNKLLSAIHQRFLANLRLLLAHPRTCEEFSAFTKLIQVNFEDYKARKALEDHLQYQWWLFNEAPVFGQERFPLVHIYADMHCGVLKWAEIRGADNLRSSRKLEEQPGSNVRRDPFSEADSPRTDLLGYVLKYIGDPEFNEPIIIQGVAGVGKSTFTLRLASELIDAGFYPIRVELRDLDINQSVLEALPHAIRFSDRKFKPFGWDPEFDPHWFTSLTQTNEEIVFGPKDARISPYVFIFDGWDEISTGATQGFKDDIDRVLTEIRTHFIDLRGHRPPIRVIVTGRPSADVTKTRLLRADTPILTIRPFTPEQLEVYIEQILLARRALPVTPLLYEGSGGEGVEKAEAHQKDDNTMLNSPGKSWFGKVLQSYREEFYKVWQFDYKKFYVGNETHRQGDTRAEPAGSVAVLGMPLLAYLAIRLMLDLDSPEQLEALLDTPTTLYRALVDMTYEKGAKYSDAPIESEHRYRVGGENLRVLLWNTAEAITATGREAISREELKLRLRWKDEELERVVHETTKDNIMSNLIISFFFKEGTIEQGCEFLHKSFREYLFAEGIIELLKRYGHDLRVAKAYERDKENGFAQRDVYWEDFEDEENLPTEAARDPRYDFTHRLAEMFATRWVSYEVKSHLRLLLKWEIERAQGCSVTSWPGLPTVSISYKEWEFVRDGLADAWDWWAEGVLLRPKPKLDERFGTPRFSSPYVVELAELCSPLEPAVWKQGSLPDVVRVTTIDSRIGEAFFYLAAIIHAELYNAARRKDQYTNVESAGFRARRRYQAATRVDDILLVRFVPSGEDASYFQNFSARINAAGWRPQGQFPVRVFAHSVILRGADLSQLNFNEAELEGADLEGAKLDGANLFRANLNGANLWGASLEETNLEGADLKRTYLDRDNLLCQIKETLMSNGPVITIEDTDYNHIRSLYLKHQHGGHDLFLEHAERSMAYLCNLWGHEVLLETVVNGKKALLFWTVGRGFSTKPLK